MQDCLDIRSDPFASSDKLQLNSISGARGVSPREGKRHPSTPVLSTYGNTWDDSGSGEPRVVNIDLESDRSGSDVLRFPRRTRTERYGNDAIAPPSTSSQPSQASGYIKRRRMQALSDPRAFYPRPNVTSLSFSIFASLRIVDSKF